MKRIVIIGATSGIGLEIAKIYLKSGWRVGIAGRRQEELIKLHTGFPSLTEFQQIDITQKNASEQLLQLIEKLGGMDVFFLSSGIGFQNPQLDLSIEINTVRTNTEGFTRMIDTAFHYFARQEKGHIAVISSIAGTKGLGVAPAYSATKRFQNTYIEALSQLSHMEKLKIRFTDIRPGFVATALLKDGKYPMLMKKEVVARHIVKAVNRGSRIKIIDFRYAILVFFWRLIPRWIWKRLPIRTK